MCATVGRSCVCMSVCTFLAALWEGDQDILWPWGPITLAFYYNEVNRRVSMSGLLAFGEELLVEELSRERSPS